ncbi:MAG: glycosyltransferase family 39 protein, partial [Anaerolineales bacterium]|nr:glycosyltransferase family 39 protein [Anaerolineales bacterium]
LNPTQHRWLVLVLLAIAFAVRIYDLADRNIWWDEGLAAWAARLSPERIVDWTAHDVHPPLYFYLLSLWWRVVGDGEFVLRFPSALAGVLGVAVIYGFGRALTGRTVGLLAAAALTVSIFAISWSQEMRMYIWAATLTTGVMWAAYRLWQKNTRTVWLAYVLTCAAALWTLYLNASVIVIVNVGFLLVWLGRKRPMQLFWRWAGAQIAALALVVPWLAYALPRIPTWSTAEPFTPNFFAQLYSTMLAVGIPVNLEDYAPLTLLLMGVWVVGLGLVWRQAASVEQRATQAMLLLGVVMPALVVYAVSLPINPFYYAPRLAPRYLLPLAPCFYVLLAYGLVALLKTQRWLGSIAVIVTLVIGVSGWGPFFANRLRHDDLVSLAETLRAFMRPTDRVVLHSDRDWPLFAAQYASDWRGVPYGAQVDATNANNLLTSVWNEADGIWLVTTPDSLRIDPQNEIHRWLEAHALAKTHWALGDNALAFYARTPERAASLHTLSSTFQPPTNLQTASLSGAHIPVPRYRPGERVHVVLYWAVPPTQPFTLELAGARTATFTLEPPMAAESGLTRQTASFALPPDLPTGHYQLWLNQSSRLEIGQLDVWPSLVANTATLADIGTPLDVRFGDSIRLRGYTLASTQIQPGGPLTLTLYWQATAPITERYKITVQLQGAEFNASSNNFLWGQQDAEPVNGLSPTTSWLTGSLIADAYALPVAADAPPGAYTLQVGVYGLIDGARLEVFNPTGELLGDAARLTEILVR